MKGTNASTGKSIEGAAWIRQAITDILTTPIGTRVGRRDYGSRLFELTDSTLNKGGLLAIYAATIEAIDKWLRDADGNRLIKILKVEKEAIASSGRVTITLTAELVGTGETTIIGGIAV